VSAFVIVDRPVSRFLHPNGARFRDISPTAATRRPNGVEQTGGRVGEPGADDERRPYVRAFPTTTLEQERTETKTLWAGNTKGGREGRTSRLAANTSP
jgi:hypothetical protein